MVATVRETDNYSYDIDRLYGTGWFVRKSDDFVQTYMHTGSDVEVITLSFGWMTDEEFETLAKSQTYSPRWQEDS